MKKPGKIWGKGKRQKNSFHYTRRNFRCGFQGMPGALERDPVSLGLSIVLLPAFVAFALIGLVVSFIVDLFVS